MVPAIEKLISEGCSGAIKSMYGTEIKSDEIQVQKTRKEFSGDITIVVFPFLKFSHKSPEKTAEEIGSFLQSEVDEIIEFNVIKGFLNLLVSNTYWEKILLETQKKNDFGFTGPIQKDHKKLMVEYSSPNTNKPLHLGHIRNNLLGYSIAQILNANGNKIIKTQIINDRGIHICKSMLAWLKWGNGETPASTGVKGDHFVGRYYVMFEQAYKKEQKELINKGMDEKMAKVKAPLFIEASEMLRKWEAHDTNTVELWRTMNGWVYEGFDATYKKMGVNFDKLYYESETYLFGKEIIEEGLKRGIFFRKEDGSVWVDLTDEGLDEKLLLRSDGTAVYITQDIGTAAQRYKDFNVDGIIYTVANEQDYHFKVLFHIMKKMGYSFWEGLYHLSYGMVELPSGRMKTREGTVVDADDLMDEMIDTARTMSVELGKLEDYTEKEKKNIYRIIGLGALKYFILKVDPRKNMTFDPKESIDFNGNTGPFIQYTYARIRSIFRKAEEMEINYLSNDLAENIINEKEKSLIKIIYYFPEIINEAAREYNPAIIANYIYDLVKEYNQFYHDYTILHEQDVKLRALRLILSEVTGNVINSGMQLLGIEVPERM